MALNLVRNSRVFFTTNVDSSTGVIKTTGFTTSNTQEIQVLDGFTFSQKTNQDTVTISEAGTDPTRGQRSFNTSLAPVDFSFSTYVRPSNASTKITAEESVLWNALLSANDTTSYSIGNVTSGSGVTYAASTGVVTIAGSSLTNIVTGTVASPGTADATKINVNDIITLTGLTTGTSTDAKYINAPCKVTEITANSIKATLLSPPPSMASISTISNSSTTLTVYKSAWAPVASNFAVAHAATSNKNQLQKFGMIFIVDNVTYAVDNCAMNQVTVDFGLDAIATLAWTGQATALRDVTSTISLTGGGASVSSTALTGLLSTENIPIGGSGITLTATGGTGALAANTTITAISGTNSLTLSTAATTNGTLTGLKLINTSATATASGSYTGTGPWIMTLTVTSTSGISPGDSVTATDAGTGSAAGSFGSNNTATVYSVDSATVMKVLITGSTTPTNGTNNGGGGTFTNVITTIANLSAVTTLTAGAKNTTAPFITNKLSTVSFKTLNALGSAAAKLYTIALTGGSVTINNNISYVTPANLGVVNVPAVYYTGTRAITGTMNAYLKTGSSETGTGQLLLDMLAAASSTVEPMAALTIAIGGKDNLTKVELDMPSVSFTIPSIDVQQVISTTINFTAAGSVPSSTTNGNTFAVDALNDLTVRYYSA